MNKYIEIYSSFFAIPLTKWIYLLLPFVIISMSIATKDLFIATIFFCLYVVFDCWAFYINFGGLLSKKVSYNDYIKSSARGMDILKKALIVDLIKRVISLIIMVFTILYTCFSKGNSSYTPSYSDAVAIIIICTLIMEFTTLGMLLISRFEKFIGLTYLCLVLIALLVFGVFID